MALATSPAGADPVLPSGGAVVAGVASIGPAAGGTLIVDQVSARAVIDWQRFSIGAGGLVQVNNGAGATLNRVLSGDPSSIMGRLAATGSVWLVNPAGVIVGPSGQVTTGGDFVASTRMIGVEPFMAGGSLVAEGAGGRVANAGSIATGGDTVLIGAMVENSGGISAGGHAALLAAGRVVLREAAGDSRIHIEHVSGAAGDVSTSGRIEAAAAELRAVSGNVYALAADTSGVVRATAADLSGGRIRLVAGQDVHVSGTLDASGSAGGRVDITAGERVILADGAQLAAR
ncbi:MAG: filamentous hemagglutinin N-terminal domain-containing protein, partial [Thermaurantiacus sp.]